MERNARVENVIIKPTRSISNLISLLGFENPEDLIYSVTQDYFQYMNYGMFPAKDSRDYDGHPEEAVNYLELFSLCPLVSGNDLHFLEIGCGLGYGSQLIQQEFRPSHHLSIDRSPHAIRYAQTAFDDTGVTYRNECFSDDTAPQNSFDVIYTVESGGMFPAREHFDLVYRLLKHDGVLLVANINPANDIANKRDFAEQAGFSCTESKDVTAQVVSYLKSEKKALKLQAAIEGMPAHKAALCRLFRKSLNEFARTPGSRACELLGSKEFYHHFCFTKPPS
jgi:SAM-dependent methyltransferase